MLPKWDYVSLYLRVNDKTRHIINAKTLKRFKPTAVLVNAARGALVDEAALIEALKAGQLGGAGGAPAQGAGQALGGRRGGRAGLDRDRHG